MLSQSIHFSGIRFSVHSPSQLTDTDILSIDVTGPNSVFGIQADEVVFNNLRIGTSKTAQALTTTLASSPDAIDLHKVQAGLTQLLDPDTSDLDTSTADLRRIMYLGPKTSPPATDLKPPLAWFDAYRHRLQELVLTPGRQLSIISAPGASAADHVSLYKRAPEGSGGGSGLGSIGC